MFGATREQLIKRYKEEWKQKPPALVTSARKGQDFFWGVGYHEVLLKNGETGQCFATVPLTKHGEKPRKVFAGICTRPLLPTDKRLVVPKERANPMPFSVTVSFNGTPNRELEKLLVKTARRETEGSGFSFITQRRDVSFGFKRRDHAVAAAKRVLRTAKVRDAEWTKGLALRVEVHGRVWP